MTDLAGYQVIYTTSCPLTLGSHQVSWLRRRGPEVSLLTTNLLVFSLDSRLGVSYEPDQENWGLVIQSAQERDSASYLCQVIMRTVRVMFLLAVMRLATIHQSDHCPHYTVFRSIHILRLL